EERLCAAISVAGKDDIRLDHMVPLRGIYNALKDGEITIEHAFPESGGLGAVQAGKRKSEHTGSATTEKKPATAPGTASAATESAAKPTETKAAGPLPLSEAVTRAPIGVIAHVHARENGSIVEL